MVICPERGADLHMAQLMPLPLIVSCFSKIQIRLTFLVPAHPGSPRQRAVKWMCVCVFRLILISLFHQPLAVLFGNRQSKRSHYKPFEKWPLNWSISSFYIGEEDPNSGKSRVAKCQSSGIKTRFQEFLITRLHNLWDRVQKSVGNKRWYWALHQQHADGTN